MSRSPNKLFRKRMKPRLLRQEQVLLCCQLMSGVLTIPGRGNVWGQPRVLKWVKRRHPWLLVWMARHCINSREGVRCHMSRPDKNNCERNGKSITQCSFAFGSGRRAYAARSCLAMGSRVCCWEVSNFGTGDCQYAHRETPTHAGEKS